MTRQSRCEMMRLIRNPIVWLLRVRHRKGYGVHSPFAFEFVTDVLYNGGRYYAYDEIDAALCWWQRGRERSLRHLLFRMANYRRPHTLWCSGLDAAAMTAVQCGSREAMERSGAGPGAVDMIVTGCEDEDVTALLGEGSMVVLWRLHGQRKLWRRLQEDDRVTVMFDLYDVGVAFARKELNRQHYIINW